MVEGEAGRCEIGDLKHVEGEASCNSRKGKLIFFYEWNLRLSWKGTGGEGMRGEVALARAPWAPCWSLLRSGAVPLQRNLSPLGWENGNVSVNCSDSESWGDCGSHVGLDWINAYS